MELPRWDPPEVSKYRPGEVLMAAPAPSDLYAKDQRDALRETVATLREVVEALRESERGSQRFARISGWFAAASLLVAVGSLVVAIIALSAP